MFSRFARSARPIARYARSASNKTAKTTTRSKTAKVTMGAGAAAFGAAAFALDQSTNQAHCAKSLYGMVADLGDRMTAIEGALGVGLSVFRSELDTIAAVKKSNPDNRAVKYFDEGWFAGLGLPAQKNND